MTDHQELEEDLLPPKPATALVLAKGLLTLIESWGADPDSTVLIGEEPLVNWDIKDGHVVLQTWEHYRKELKA